MTRRARISIVLKWGTNDVFVESDWHGTDKRDKMKNNPP